MKHTIIAFVFCALSAVVNAQTVTVADVEALPGETVAFKLNLTGGKPDTYTAMQFDVQFPTSGFTTTGKYTVSEQWPNATANVGNVDANGVATVPVASSEVIAGTDVEELLTVMFTVGNDVALGVYDVTLTNLWLGYGTSSKDVLNDVTFKVNVVTAHSVVLDETSTTAPEAATGVDVRVRRTIKAGQWSTICLPFTMTEEQCKEAFGSDVQIAEFTGWTTTDYDEDDNPSAIKVTFANVTAIAANTPYIIKVSEPVTEFTADGVTIEPEEEPSVTVGKRSKGTLGTFTGSYVPTTIDEESLFLSDNQFWYSTGQTQMKGFRAYFYFQDVLGSYYEDAASKDIVMVFEDVTTGIKRREALNAEGEEQWYNLAGQRVAVPQKGLYIKNGKKIVK